MNRFQKRNERKIVAFFLASLLPAAVYAGEPTTTGQGQGQAQEHASAQGQSVHRNGQTQGAAAQAKGQCLKAAAQAHQQAVQALVTSDGWKNATDEQRAGMIHAINSALDQARQACDAGGSNDSASSSTGQ